MSNFAFDGVGIGVNYLAGEFDLLTAEVVATAKVWAVYVDVPIEIVVRHEAEGLDRASVVVERAVKAMSQVLIDMGFAREHVAAIFEKFDGIRASSRHVYEIVGESNLAFWDEEREALLDRYGIRIYVDQILSEAERRKLSRDARGQVRGIVGAGPIVDVVDNAPYVSIMTRVVGLGEWVR